ncbi:MAG: rubrerythrin family protein [Alistipes sp.]|jgi:rubrerythrin|uniref:rubrerythrin family protein n=1 Tax=Alistipes TaxID=239759 RepID=UPI00203C5EF5|nr:rubrerythrin family protein [Alistipes muris]MCI9244530.1 rubrerythrin family protein [Alistipes sp.]
MKLRPLFILILFVVSTAILGWIYYKATHPQQEKPTETWHEIIADLDACCRRKHVKSMQYDHFATIAEQESRQQIARLFRAMALSERLQEHNCADAIQQLGGEYLPPEKIVVFRGDTDGNLERSIAYELRTTEECKCGEIDRAIACDNRFAARLLTWSSSVDMRNAAFMHLCRIPEETAANWEYLVCPRCGNLFISVYCEPYCPFCLTSGRQFVRFE